MQVSHATSTERKKNKERNVNADTPPAQAPYFSGIRRMREPGAATFSPESRLGLTASNDGPSAETEALGHAQQAPAGEEPDSGGGDAGDAGEAGGVAGGAAGSISKASEEQAAFDNLAENFDAYDTDGNNHLTEDEIREGLDEVISDDIQDAITDDLNVLQTVNGAGNSADGETGNDEYRNLTINDINAIQDKLDDGQTLDEIKEEARTSELTNDNYIPTNDAEFEQEVEDLAGRLDVTTTSDSIPRGSVGRGDEEASGDQKKVIAREILELYGDNPEIVDEVLDDQDLRIVLSDGDNGDLGGLAVKKHGLRRFGGGLNPFNNDQGYLYLDLESTQAGINDPGNGYEVISHEFSHFVDFENNSNIDDNETYKDIREDFFNRFDEEVDERFDGDKPDFGHEFYGEDSVVPGLRNYAFESEEEFFAVTLELYKENPEQLRSVSPELYELYKDQLGLPQAA